MDTLTLILLSLCLSQGAPSEPATKDLVKIPVASVVEYQQLQDLISDVDDHQSVGDSGMARAYATDAEQAILRAANIPFTVEIEDLQSFYAARAATELGSGAAFASVGSMGGFRTLAEIEQELDRLSAAFPAICSPKFSVGTTIQGRNIWAIRISTTPTVHDPGKAVAWYDAMHHSREPMSGESLLMFANEILTGYGSNADATRLVETRNMIFIPCVNPDGYEYNRQIAPNGGGMWRKNRRNNLDGTYGVDLNRNYDWEWGPQWPGSSSNTSSETYRGTSPFSEPETQALATLMSTMPPKMSMSVHTYSDLMLYPWGYNTIVTNNDALYREFGASFTANNGWPFGTIWQVLYIANGGSVDYHYGTYGTIAFTPEIGGDSDGFWPAPSRIPALYEDVRPSYLETAKGTGAWAQVDDLVWTEISGDGDAWQEPGESWGLQLQMFNLGLSALDVNLGLSSTSPHLSISGAQSNLQIGARSTALSSSFLVDFDANAPTGQPLALQLGLDYESWVSSNDVLVTLGRQRVLIRDRMEANDFGWSSNVQTNWSWERANPQGTTSSGSDVQPENDHTPNGSLCWVTGAAAGSSVGTNDVDGTAILTSPTFNLDSHSNATLSYARWFANRPGSSLDDRWLSELSNDGGSSWVALEDLGDTGSAWRDSEVALHGVLPFTDQMRLRFLVADDPNNDITEGLLDDLEIRTLQGAPTLGLWGASQVGETMRFTIDGDPGASFSIAWSLATNGGTTYPGIEGSLYLAAPQVFLTGSCAADGVATSDLTVPVSVAGRTVYLQGIIGQGTPSAAFTTLTSASF
ncbi:MAG: M14 family metallopeptidase [Planctomycetota bacterium]|nr:M14 family metallopeptidase [Planctomycetota bacterium]